MTPARILGAAPALIAAAAALALLAYATAHHLRKRRTAPRPAAAGHRQVVEAALWDWWITTDPLEPFAPAAVADQVDLYLVSSGYVIAPNTQGTRPVPTRRDIATVVVLAVVCTGSVIGAAFRGDWEWVCAGTLGTVFLTRESIHDIRDRRHGRPGR